MPGEMIINANEVPVTSLVGSAPGIPLTYYSPAAYAPPNGWIGSFGGFTFIFSATTEVITDSQGVPIGFTVHFDGTFQMYGGGWVQVGSGTMPQFDYVSGAGDAIQGSGSLLQIHAGPFGEFIENLDRVVFNGSDVANAFDATYLHANMVINGGGGADQLFGSNLRANDIYGGEGDDYIHGNSVLDRLYGEAGEDYITDGDGTGLYTIFDPDFLYGGADNDRLVASGGNDYLDGGSGDDQLVSANYTMNSNDTFVGGIGNDSIDGGAGFDTAVFSGNRSQYVIAASGGGVTVSGPDGNDFLARVERLRFDDGIVLLDGSNAPIITSDGGGDTAAIFLPETLYSVTTVTATDGDPNDELTYSIVGGDDAAFFTIHGTAGFLGFAQGHDFENPADADHDNIYEVIVQVADALGNTDTQAISITVTNVNDSAPAFVSGNAVDFAENGVGTAYQASATDADNLGPLTYSLSGTDAELFNIADNGAVTFKATPDFETPSDANADNIYEIVVTASDGTLAANQNVAITVTDAADTNTPPTISIGDVTVTEGIDSSAVFTVTLSNASATPVSVQFFTSAGNQSIPGFASGGSDFTQIGGGLTFAPGETTKTISVPIVDDQSQEAAEIFYVNLYNASGATILGTGQAVGTILDNDVPPTITSLDGVDHAFINLPESSTAVATVTATDPDSVGLTYSISGGFDQGFFTIDSVTGELTWRQAPDYERPLDPPYPGSPTAQDQLYDVQVRVTDSGGNFDEQLITIAVTNANDAPSLTVPGAQSTTTQTGLAIQGIVVADQDSGDTFIVNIANGAPGAYLTALGKSFGGQYGNVIGSGTPNVTITGSLAEVNATLATLGYGPYDAAPGPDSIMITVTDAAGASTNATVPVTIVNTPPVITFTDGASLNTPIDVAENTTGVFAMVTGSDVDLPADTLTWSIGPSPAGNYDNEFFAIDPQTGGLSFVAPPDFEFTDPGNDDLYLVQVSLTDASGASTTRDIAIRVTNVNDAPTLAVPGSQSTTTQVGLAIQGIVVSDQDSGDTFIVNIANGAPGAYLTALGKSFGGQYGNVIGSGTPNVTITGSVAEVNATLATLGYGPYDAAPGPDSIMITVTDAAGASTDATIPVTILNTPPTIASNGGGDTAAISVAENTAAVTTVAATDPDAGTTLTYSIAGGFDGNLFQADATTGALSFIQPEDYENPSLNNGAFDHFYDVLVRATDSQGAFDEQLITVTLTNAPGVTINGTGGADTVNATQTVAGQPLPTNEEDIVNGNGGGDILHGLGGNDLIDGGAGADQMFGGIGNDTYVVANTGDIVDETDGDGIDTVRSSIAFNLSNTTRIIGPVENLTLTGTGNLNGTGNALSNMITGNDGNNILAGLGGADTLVGGDGTDTASYDASTAGVEVSLMTGLGQGGAEGDTLSGIENLRGSDLNDTLEGDGANNVLQGRAGIDTISYANATAAVTVSLAITSAQNTVGAGIDTLTSFENLSGSAFDDTLTGNGAANTISGLAGNDQMTGGGGQDTLSGGSGNDVLVGGAAADVLIGGDDNDRFVFNALAESGPSTADTVSDFLHGSDTIDVSAIDANTSVGGNQAFAFAGQNTNVVARSITWFESGGNTIIRGDVNGNSTAEFVLVLAGTNHNLAASDFVL